MKIEKVFNVKMSSNNLSFNPVGLAKEYHIYLGDKLWKVIKQPDNLIPDVSLPPYGDTEDVGLLWYMGDVEFNTNTLYSIGLYFEDFSEQVKDSYNLTLINEGTNHYIKIPNYNREGNKPDGVGEIDNKSCNFTTAAKFDYYFDEYGDMFNSTSNNVIYNLASIYYQPFYNPQLLSGKIPKLYILKPITLKVSKGGYYSIKTIPLENTNREASDFSERVFYDGKISCTFYKNSAEPHRVDKTNYLEEVYSYRILLKESCSITQPSLILSIPEFPRFNYCYIPQFDRYYYVTNITSINTDLWQIDLTVDVLMSYKEKLATQVALIGRNEFEWNEKIVDSAIMCDFGESVTYEQIDMFNYHPDPRDSVFAISVVGTNSGVINDRYLSNGKSAFGSSISKLYLARSPQVVEFLESLVNPDFWTAVTETFVGDPTANVIQILELPLPDLGNLLTQDVYDVNGALVLSKDCYELTNEIPVAYGKSYHSTETLVRILSNNIIKKRSVQFVNHYDSFLDLPPYTSKSIYLPFVGVVPYTYDMYLRSFYIDYVFDIDTNTVTVTAVDVNDNILGIWSGTAGRVIPLNRSTSRELVTGYINAGLSLMSGVIGSFSSMPSFSSASETDLDDLMQAENTKFNFDVTRGALRSMRSLIDSSTSHSQLSKGGSNSILSGFYYNNIIILTKKVSITEGSYDGNYNHIYGKPLNQFKQLKDVHGFTVVTDLHLEGIGTLLEEEHRDLMSLLKSGVLLP